MKSTPRRRPLAVVAAALVLVVGADTLAFGATGGRFILGQVNQASKPSVLRNTGNGPALNLQSKAGHPSLAVSSNTRVPRLNADRVDNLEGAQLATRTKVYIDKSAGSKGAFHQWQIPLGAGSYSISYTAGVVPTIGSAAAPNTVACGFLGTTAANDYNAVTTFTYTGAFSQAFLSGVDTIKVPAATELIAFCQVANGTFALDTTGGFRASVTRVTSSSTAPLQPGSMRMAPRQGLGGR